MKRLLKKFLSAFHITWETENYCAHEWFTRKIFLQNGDATVALIPITYCKKCQIDKEFHDMQAVQEYARVAAPSDFGTTESDES